ncbi:hypothetical protein GF325_17905 [Candidatus Bathyarchaeota archaeon]|nr:hypothetical protein [Candidatus Bathyarchaeota archaeon]
MNAMTRTRKPLKDRRKWIMQQSIAAGTVTCLIVLLSMPLFGIIHPLGGLLQPRGGIFDHADDGIHPKHERVRDASLSGEVTVYRDEFGVPHVFAEYLDDMYFAEGYVMALDRLWEMDILRRLASGRLAEVIPAPSVPGLSLDPQIVAMVDQYFRMYGLADAGQDLIDKVEALGTSSIEYRMATRFIDGINKAIKVMKKTNRIPLEFTLLNYEPARWEKIDVAVVGMLISYMLSLSTVDLTHTMLAETVGSYIESAGGKYDDAGFSALFPETNGSLPYECPIIPDNDTIFKGGTPRHSSRRGEMLSTITMVKQIMDAVAEFMGLPVRDGVVPASNNWVVDGNKTQNGLPILCGDPHLIIMQPAIFYEIHLCCQGPEPMNVHGVTFPGLPVILIGFNDKVAWSLTSFGSDASVDYYLETNNDTHYFFNGSWIPMNITQETIRVRGAPDITLQVRKTHHGPIISDLGQAGELSSLLGDQSIDLHGIEGDQDTIQENMSMSWITAKNTDKNVLTCMYKLNIAKNLSMFIEGLSDWATPPQNLAYGDVDGNIAMFLPGLHPVRAKEGDYDPKKYTGSFVQPGNGSGEEWVGFIPYDHVPRSINPNQSYLVSANQRSILAEDYNYSVGRQWTENYRGRRINDLVNHTQNITMETMIAFQADIHDLAAERFVPTLLDALSLETLSGDYQLAFQEMMEWNGSLFAYEMRKEWISPTIFEYFLRFLEAETWDDEWQAAGASNGSYPSLQYLEYMVRENLTSPWFDDISTGGTEDGYEIIVRAFKKTIDYISLNIGNLTDTAASWKWGNQHKLMPASLLNAIDLLLLGNDVGIPYDGSGRCPDNAPVFGEFPGIVAGGPSWRQIVDFSDMENPMTVLPMGNSGSMFSTHWDDQLYLFVNNQYKKPCRANNTSNFLAADVESRVTFST